MDLRIIAACIALLGAALAGCVGDAPSGGPGGPAETDGGNATDDDASPDGGVGVGTRTFDAPANASVRWANGSYGPTDGGVEYCLTGDCQDLRTAIPVAIGDLVPREVPVVVHAELTTQAHGSFAWLELSAPGADVYRHSVAQELSTGLEGEASRVTLDARLGAFGDDPVEVVVKPSSSGASAETEYTLRIEVEAWSEQVPAEAPVAVPVADPATLQVEPAPGDVLAWGPDDRFLGRLGGDGPDVADLDAAASGDLVLMSVGDEPIRVTADRSGEEPLRLVRRTVQTGDLHQLSAPSDEVSWGFDVPTDAYRVGTVLKGSSGSPTFDQYVRTNVTGTLASPEGTVGRTNPDNLAGGTDWAATLASTAGEEGFAPGAWTATWRTDNSGPMEAFHLVYGYER